MAWLSPAAFVGLLALAGPILVHLLRRRQARRLVVPSVRFVAAADESSIHLRRLSDPALLLVRLAIVAVAVMALARPLVMTDARAARWAERVSRAVVVDTSESARSVTTDDTIAAQRAGAAPLTNIATPDLGRGLKQAAAWLAHTPPSRREIVVVSDFQRGALDERDVSAVPPALGIRFVRVERSSPPDIPVQPRLVGEVSTLSSELELRAEATQVAYTVEPPSWDGLDIQVAPSDSAAVTSLRRVLSRAGAQAPAPENPIVIRFPGAERAAVGPPTVDGWAFGAGQRLLQAIRGVDVPVSVTTTASSLVVDVETDPGSLAAAQVTAAALNARLDPDVLAERETASIAAETLSAWSREPLPPDLTEWRRTDESDGRLFWALALMLLGGEALLRRSTAKITEGAEPRAA